MTRIFIVEPETGKLWTAEEWKNRAEKKAKFIVIVPGDGSKPFAIANHDIGGYPWKKAKEMVGAMSDTLNNEPFAEWDLPTRKQWIDIREARSCGLDQVLEMTGGEALLKNFRRGDWFWTSEVWVRAGTSAEDYEKEKENAISAWCSYGNLGYANNGSMYSSLLALPLLLYNFREANL
ncbi:MAG: hypothetical protein II841_04820 [Bacteroidales bacterium]|nr:hypothetical protein [Bacteroidales bacterium]